MDYITLKVANQIAGKLIDNGISQSLVTENRKHRVVEKGQKRDGGDYPLQKSIHSYTPYYITFPLKV